jgi:hypothetical protein
MIPSGSLAAGWPPPQGGWLGKLNVELAAGTIMIIGLGPASQLQYAIAMHHSVAATQINKLDMLR